MKLQKNNSVLTKLNQCFSCELETTDESSGLINWHDVLITHPPKSLLAEMVTEPEMISSQLEQLENNARSRYLCFDRNKTKLKILVVEDRDNNRDYISSILRQENFQVIEARDSDTAIHLARSQCPDLIICELLMPVIDGYGILHFLRQSATTRKIPLLFIVGYTESTTDDSSLIAIAQGSTIEPLTTPKLLAAITHKLLAIAQT